MEDNKIIGIRIKQRREQLNLTQEELGTHLSLNKSTINRYESGEVQKIKIPILHALAEFLDVDPNWLALKTNDMGSFPKSIDEKSTPDSEDAFSQKDIEFLKKVNLLNPDFMRIALAVSPLDSKSLAEVADIVEAIAKLKAKTVILKWTTRLIIGQAITTLWCL